MVIVVGSEIAIRVQILNEAACILYCKLGKKIQLQMLGKVWIQLMVGLPKLLDLCVASCWGDVKLEFKTNLVKDVHHQTIPGQDML